MKTKILLLLWISCLILSNAYAASISVRAFSAGFDDPGYYGGVAYLWVNGVDYSNNYRGMNLVVVNEYTGSVLSSTYYDTHASTAAADSMAAFINALPAGRIVLVAVKDEAAQSMTATGINALYTLGASSFTPGYRGSWALIGMKGAAMGTQIQATAAQFVGPVDISSTILLIPEPATLAMSLLGLLFFVFHIKRIGR